MDRQGARRSAGLRNSFARSLEPRPPRITQGHLAGSFRAVAAAVFMVGVEALAQATPSGASHSEARPKSWAVLIGIEGYEKVRPLEHTVNDVLQLSATLQARGGFERDCIEEITESAGDETKRPFKRNLFAGLPKWLSQPGLDDSLILYFSGHGIRDRSGKLYLVPLDGDPADPAATMIPLDWFRKRARG